MKNILILLFIFATHNLWAVCSAPISRTAVGANSVLTSTKYNLDLNTVYNRTNNLPGDCILDDSINGSKIVDGTISAPKLANNSVTTDAIADVAITAAKLSAAIENLIPVGTILSYGGTTAPPGFILGTGQSLSRATYNKLFAVYGTSFGAADGVSFNNIDCRGRFFRYWDNGVGRDPDRASRTASATGGNIGDNIGSIQGSQFTSHNHVTANLFAGNAGIYSGFPNSYTGTSSVMSTTSTSNSWLGYTSTQGGNEDRPININVNCIVKY